MQKKLSSPASCPPSPPPTEGVSRAARSELKPRTEAWLEALDASASNNRELIARTMPWRPPGPPSPGVPRILVVEDEKSLADFIVWVIRAKFPEAAIEVVADGDEAWQRILAQPPDLLITDGQHPGLPGDQLVERAATFNRRFPIVWTAGDGAAVQQERRRQFARLGLDVDFHPKPFSLLELVETLAGRLEAR